MEESMEFRTIINCTSQLEQSLRKHRKQIALFLLENDFILPDTYDEVMNPTSWLTENDKAYKLMKGLRDEIELNSKKYKKFVDYLSKDPMRHEVILNALSAEFAKLTGGSSVESFNNTENQNLSVYIDISNMSGIIIKVDLLNLDHGHWESCPCLIQAEQTTMFVAKGCDGSGDVIGKPAMKLSLLGSVGATECEFSFTNTTPPAPFLKTSGFIPGIRSVEPTYRLQGTALRGSVRLS